MLITLNLRGLLWTQLLSLSLKPRPEESNQMNEAELKSLIASYAQASEEDLELSLGRILLSSEIGPTAAAAADDKRALDRVSEYLNTKWAIFRAVVCVHIDLDGKLKDNPFASNLEIIAAISDLIAPVVGLPPAAMVATLLFKRGIDLLCVKGVSDADVPSST
jgi:hypothetical protein